MKNIIFIAPPAAGKGTQSTLLKEKFGYSYISCGDLLRKEIACESKFGVLVKNIIKDGKLVSDDLIINLIKEKLSNLDGKPFILDGFPRTLNQAVFLDNYLTKDYVVIYLDLKKEDALSRVLSRLICECGNSYNLVVDKLKPKKEGICDKCGNILNKRLDDNIDSFNVRYKNFYEYTKPLLDYYESKKILYKIDVNKNVESVFKDIVDVCND